MPTPAPPATRPPTPAPREGGEPADAPRGALWGHVALRTPSPESAEAGRPLDPSTRARMERSFARDFSAVRLHDGAEGARAAGSALAVAAGDDIALSSAAPRPGTLRGDALLAHELAHTAQQARATSWGGGSPAALEDEANAAAASAVLGTPMPRLRASPLQLRACTYSEAQKQQAFDLMADPRNNQAALISAIDAVGRGLPEVLNDHPMFLYKGQGSLRDWASIPGAQAVLQHISDRLGEMGSSGAPIKSNVDAILAERTRPDATRTTADQDELKKINAAIDADPRKAEYTDPKKYDPPLTFPVQFYQPGRQVGGQVYYDTSLPREGGKGGETGGGTTLTGSRGGVKTYEIQVYSWIRLGPAILSSDEMIRSALYHEALHYRIGLEEKKGTAGDAVAQQIAGLDRTKTDATGQVTAANANDDVEVLGIQIRDDAAKLSVDDVAKLLWYLAYQLHTGFVLQDFKDRCFDRIASAAAADAAVKTKLLSALASTTLLDKRDRTALTDLKTKVKAAAAPRAPAAPAKKK